MTSHSKVSGMQGELTRHSRAQGLSWGCRQDVGQVSPAIQDLTGTEESIPKMAHTFDCWPEASVPHNRIHSVRCPCVVVTGFPWRGWPKRAGHKAHKWALGILGEHFVKIWLSNRYRKLIWSNIKYKLNKKNEKKMTKKKRRNKAHFPPSLRSHALWLPQYLSDYTGQPYPWERELLPGGRSIGGHLGDEISPVLKTGTPEWPRPEVSHSD